MEKGNFNALILNIDNECTFLETMWYSLKVGACLILKLAYRVYFPFFIYSEFLSICIHTYNFKWLIKY